MWDWKEFPCVLRRPLENKFDSGFSIEVLGYVEAIGGINYLVVYRSMDPAHSSWRGPVQFMPEKEFYEAYKNLVLVK